MSTQFTPQEIPLKATLDVEEVERALNQLWRENAGAGPESDEEGALMRARVLNLMVYVLNEQAASEVNQVLQEVAVGHPCRALVMLAQREAADKDIELFISAYCPSKAQASGRRLCCEQVTLRASGHFTVELPSAATPLLVTDLPVFLWWRDRPRPESQEFQYLTRAATRLVIDSVTFTNPYQDMLAIASLLRRGLARHTAISDFNWSRLTSWRELLASFYDIEAYHTILQGINRVNIKYVAPEGSPEAIAPQALMMAGWLAGRLNWRILPELAQTLNDGSHQIGLEKEGRRIFIELQRVERPEMKPGRLARVELRAEDEGAGRIDKAEIGECCTFTVLRSENGLYLETCAAQGVDVKAARVLPVRNRSAAILLGRELEITSRDRIYEQAIEVAADMLKALGPHLDISEA